MCELWTSMALRVMGARWQAPAAEGRSVYKLSQAALEDSRENRIPGH